MDTTVLLVDDHKIFRMGLNLLITEEPDMQVVGEAWDEQTAINQVRKLAPDVVVMDIHMPGMDGIEATRRISSNFPDTKIIALSIHGERHFVEDMLQAGATGYVLKESIPEELVDGIKSVAQGEVYLSEAVRDAVVSGYVSILSREEKASELAKHYDTADGPILVTKLHRPRISASTVPRVRLWEQLEAGRGRPLTLVSAPAGYGKSTVISQWLETYECPSAWLSLDEQDSDLRTFLAYLTAAIQTLFPGAVPRTTALLKAADLPPLRILAGTLINEIEDVSQRFVLVIDDYHRINEPSVHDLLGEILRHSPQHLHLVLATRTDPPLDLLQLRAYRQMGEIRGHDLRFTRDETRALLQQVMDAPVGKEVATLLTARTDGWAIGLHLITLALRDVHDLENISITLPGEQQTLDYLVAEALSRQPREIQSWLLKSSILDRFQAPLCEAVCAAPGESAAPPGQGISAGINGEAFLDWLRGNNLFVISLDNHGRWFRYHHLFQQLLQSQLAMAIDDGDIAALHGRASAWLAENGLIEESFQHALAAGDIPGAAQLVKQHRYSMMNAEQWSRLNQLLDMLPPEATENNPSLLLAKAFCFDYRGEMAEVSTLFNRVKPLVVGVLPESPDDIGVQGEYYSLLAELNYLSAEGKLALASSKKALELLPSEAQYIRNLARNWYVFSLQMKGDLARGLQVVYEAIDSPVNLKRTTNIMGYRCLCALYFMDGDLSRLKQSALRVLTLAEEQQLSESLGIAGYFLGTLHYLRNELAEASKYIDININNRYSARVAYHAQCAFVQALIYISQGQPEEAWSVVESVIAFGDETHNAYVMEACRVFKVELALRQNKTVEAEQLMKGVNFDLLPPLWFFYHSQLTLTKVQLVMGGPENYRKAAERLDQFYEFGKAAHNKNFVIQVLALQALLHDAQDQEIDALEKLNESLTLAELGGFIRNYVDLGPRMADLLARLHSQGVAKKSQALPYIAQILDAFANEPGKAKKRDAIGRRGVEPVGASLTRTEKKVLQHLATNLSPKEIAEELTVSVATVRTHAKRIYSKLDAHTRMDAVAAARELGLL